MAFPKSMEYVVLGWSVSANCTVTRFPEEETLGASFDVGDTVTLVKASFTFMSSLKSIVTFRPLKLTEYGIGLERNATGGSSSRGPPEGLPVEAQEYSMTTAIAAADNGNMRSSRLFMFKSNLSSKVGIFGEKGLLGGIKNEENGEKTLFWMPNLGLPRKFTLYLQAEKGLPAKPAAVCRIKPAAAAGKIALKQKIKNNVIN